MTHSLSQMITGPASVALALCLFTTPGLAGEYARAGASSVEQSHGSTVDHRSPSRGLVRCDRGQRLAHAIGRANPGDRIEVAGTCRESIRITKGGLKIVGRPGAMLDGSGSPAEAVVLVDGVRSFTLENIDVENGSDQGLLVRHGGRVVLKNVRLRRNATIGLSVDRSNVEIHDVSADENGTGGMDAYSGSTVVAFGKISAVGNRGDGIAVNGKAFLELRGAQVTASDNAGSGVSIINDSRLQIFSFPEAQGSTITANGNTFAGIGVLGAQLGVVGSQYFGSGANVISATNNLFGFFMPAGAILSPHATARFVASGNAVGMLMEDGATALIVGGLDLKQNGTGLSAIGAGTLNLVSVPPNPAVIQGNQKDVDLGFGTRVTIDGVAFTSLSCDSTVLVRGATC